MRLKSFAKSIFQNLLIIVSISVALLFLYSGVSSFFNNQSYEPIINNLSFEDLSLLRTKSVYEQKTNKIIKMEILNGCGESGIASRYTKFLMSLGYDVLDNSNANSFNYEKSIIKLHTANHDMAQEIAKAMGMEEESIIEDLNPNLTFDVSLILGKDYKNLESFHNALYYQEKKFLNGFE
jgi:hypothetical protein